MRKSRSLRLAQAKEALEDFKSAGLENSTSAGRFLQDVIPRMERGKYPTKRQRDWLDTIIDSGPPEPPENSKALVEKIDIAMAVDGIQFNHILSDFKSRLIRGYDLSEKQLAFCENLIQKAADIQSGNIWTPDSETRANLELAVELSKCYTTTYWSTHPGSYQALSACSNWLSGSTTYVEKYHADKLLRTMAKKIKEIKEPKFLPGDICYFGKNNDVGIVMSEPYVAATNHSSFCIVWDVLIEGTVQKVSNAKKRRS